MEGMDQVARKTSVTGIADSRVTRVSVANLNGGKPRSKKKNGDEHLGQRKEGQSKVAFEEELYNWSETVLYRGYNSFKTKIKQVKVKYQLSTREDVQAAQRDQAARALQVNKELVQEESWKFKPKSKGEAVSATSRRQDYYAMRKQREKTLLSYAVNVPDHVLKDPRFAWMYKDDPQREILMESKDVGGFRVVDSDSTSESSEVISEEELDSPMWVKELYTDSSMTSLLDDFYHIIDYKDHEGQVIWNVTHKEEREAAIREAQIPTSKIRRTRFKGLLQRFWPRRVKPEPKWREKEVLESPFGELNIRQRYDILTKLHKGSSSSRKASRVGVILCCSLNSEHLSMSRDRCFRIPKQPEPDSTVPLNPIQAFLDHYPSHTLKGQGSEGLSLLQSGLYWARIYQRDVTLARGQLILDVVYLLSFELYRWFPLIIEAIINRRLNSKKAVYRVLAVLLDLHQRKLTIDQLMPLESAEKEDYDLHILLRNTNKKAFSSLLRRVKKQYCELRGRDKIPFSLIAQIYDVTMNHYRSGLKPFLDDIAAIIVQGRCKNTLEMAELLSNMSGDSKTILPNQIARLKAKGVHMPWTGQRREDNSFALNTLYKMLDD